ncbi:MAG TPA: hypothetical protein VD884_04700 [Ohtaekwangia sp.]|nr:hypothetical protein [Ohtaekwangia sp.]
MYSGFLAALTIALLLTILSVFVFKRSGPWGTAWSFFLVLFLGLWALSLYVRAIGPVYWGVSWLPIVFGGIMLSILLIAVMPDASHLRDDVNREKKAGRPTDIRPDLPIPKAGRFFWILIILFVIAILIGMVNPQMAL